MILLQLREDSIQHTAFGPAIHAGIDRVPVAKTCGLAAPFTAPLGHVQDRVQHSQIGQTYVAALGWQTVLDQAVVRFGDFHARSRTNRMISVNTP